MNENFEWFLEQYNELSELYGDSFIVIKDRQVINTYTTYAEAVLETQKTESLGTFIVQECRKNGEMFQCRIASMNFS